jgi:hypothetical protein
MLRTIFPITLEKNWMLRTIFRKKIGCSARFFEKKLDAPHDFSNYIGKKLDAPHDFSKKNWMLRTIFPITLEKN